MSAETQSWWRVVRSVTAVAQLIAICSSSILAETRCLSSPCSGQSREKRSVSEKRTSLPRDELEPSTNADKLSDELLLKLGLRVSPQTVRKYLPKRVDHSRGRRRSSQRWQTFVRNHAQAIIACDFCVVVTATLRLLDVFVVTEHATRRMLHCNVTAHPMAHWMLQQWREAPPAAPTYRVIAS